MRDYSKLCLKGHNVAFGVKKRSFAKFFLPKFEYIESLIVYIISLK